MGRSCLHSPLFHRIIRDPPFCPVTPASSQAERQKNSRGKIPGKGGQGEEDTERELFAGIINFSLCYQRFSLKFGGRALELSQSNFRYLQLRFPPSSLSQGREFQAGFQHGRPSPLRCCKVFPSLPCSYPLGNNKNPFIDLKAELQLGVTPPLLPTSHEIPGFLCQSLGMLLESGQGEQMCAKAAGKGLGASRVARTGWECSTGKGWENEI